MQITAEHVEECARHIDRIERARGKKLTMAQAKEIGYRFYDERDLWYDQSLDPGSTPCPKCGNHVGGLPWCGEMFITRG